MYVFNTKDQSKPQLVKFPPKQGQLDTFQKYVEGNIEILPHKKGYEAPFLAYANEEGMMENLPSNYLSWGVLRHLGFHCSLAIPFHFGNVILMGHNERALTKDQQAQVDKAFHKYLKEMGEEAPEVEPEADEIIEEEKRPAKKARKE